MLCQRFKRRIRQSEASKLRISTARGETEPSMLRETCSAANKPLDFESQKSYREVVALNVCALLGKPSQIKFGHDSALISCVPFDLVHGTSQWVGVGWYPLGGHRS